MAARLKLLLRVLLLTFLLKQNTAETVSTVKSPFTARAAAIRYYDRKISNGFPLPPFLLSKLSPLSAAAAAALSADPVTLLPAFCSAAGILCSSSSQSCSSKSHPCGITNFASYMDQNFTNYGTGQQDGSHSFSQYSGDLNLPTDSFRRYSRNSDGHSELFTNYAPNGNIVAENFTSYGVGAATGSGHFTNYASEANGPNLRFTSYDNTAKGRKQSFSTYSENSNAGEESFAGYGRHGSDVNVEFSGYAKNDNAVMSTFSSYGKDGGGANDTFTSYADEGNVPENNFRSYGENGNYGSDTFTSYRNSANVGDDSFQSYAKHGNGDKASFVNYGASFNPGSTTFKAYGDDNRDDTIEFKTYSGDNNTFKDYATNSITVFSDYKNSSDEGNVSVKTVNRRVEQGRFFREAMLKPGTVMQMPDIRDKMPKRSFLPRPITKQLPFNATELSRIFSAQPNSSLDQLMRETVQECEREPSRGETKLCAVSAEDMVDFAVTVLGADITVRSTENVNGSGELVIVGEVKAINGGNVTKSVSCHQSLFPYLVYYCHSVPKVRVYEAEILAVKRGKKINRGVAICHLDTSAWGPTHGAFVALDGKPGEIEVCHWIFEGDMTWTIIDRRLK